MTFVKPFDVTIAFRRVQVDKWLPLVNVTFVPPSAKPFVLPLIFDTGASQITLRPDFASLFPAGTPAQAVVGGNVSTAQGTETKCTVQVFGRTLPDRIILFLDLGPANPLFAGLLGRDCFDTFGFGFWESARELYVSLTP